MCLLTEKGKSISHLIEREDAVAKFCSFLKNLPEKHRGVLRITGFPHSGRTYFLNVVECIASQYNYKVISLLKSNSEKLRISDLIETFPADALKAIPRLAQAKREFDLIFIAPPYFKELTQKSLKLLDDNPLVSKDGIVIAQLHKKEKKDIYLSKLELFKTKKHGITVIQFYRRKKD